MNNREKSHIRKPSIPLTALLLIFVVSGPAVAVDGVDTWQPFSTAPAGEWGGLFSGEYEIRTVDDANDVAIRRVLTRLGWTPSSFMALWIEGGVASLEIERDDKHMQGDFGFAGGAGITLSPSNLRFLSLAPFASGRLMMFISKAGGEWSEGSLKHVSLRSRFEWWEGCAQFGISSLIGRNLFFGGLAVRGISQVEDRLTRVNNTPACETYTYSSGLEPGLVAGLYVPLGNRFNAWIVVEGYQEGVRFTVSAGQWGKP